MSIEHLVNHPFTLNLIKYIAVYINWYIKTTEYLNIIYNYYSFWPMRRINVSISQFFGGVTIYLISWKWRCKLYDGRDIIITPFSIIIITVFLILWLWDA